MREGINSILNLRLSDSQWLSPTLPIKDDSLGIPRVNMLAPPALMASAAGTRQPPVLHVWEDWHKHCYSFIQCRFHASRTRISTLVYTILHHWSLVSSIATPLICAGLQLKVPWLSSCNAWKSTYYQFKVINTEWVMRWNGRPTERVQVPLVSL